MQVLSIKRINRSDFFFQRLKLLPEKDSHQASTQFVFVRQTTMDDGMRSFFRRMCEKSQNYAEFL